MFFVLLLLINGAALWKASWCFLALIEYLYETQINERIVIKRKISDNVSRNGIIENQWSFLR